MREGRICAVDRGACVLIVRTYRPTRTIVYLAVSPNEAAGAWDNNQRWHDEKDSIMWISWHPVPASDAPQTYRGRPLTKSDRRVYGFLTRSLQARYAWGS